MIQTSLRHISEVSEGSTVLHQSTGNQWAEMRVKRVTDKFIVVGQSAYSRHDGSGASSNVGLPKDTSRGYGFLHLRTPETMAEFAAYRRVVAKQQQEQTQRAKQHDKRRRDYCRDVIHDLRNPDIDIRAAIDLLLRAAYELRDGEYSAGS
jgi:hypothetical protein